MDLSGTSVSLRAIMGEEELVVSWLAERNLLPVKNEWGRYTLEEGPDSPWIGAAIKFLIIDNLGVDSDEDLERVQRAVLEHPRWSGDERGTAGLRCESGGADADGGSGDGDGDGDGTGN